MMAKDWVAEIAADISVDDLPESYQAVAEIVGIDATLKLAHHLGGAGFYFRKIDAMLRYKRDEKIRAAFTGANQKELAREYDLTERQIRNILQAKPFVQPGLFDDLKVTGDDQK
jgi:Mor family transcriptional regulator